MNFLELVKARYSARKYANRVPCKFTHLIFM